MATFLTNCVWWADCVSAGKVEEAWLIRLTTRVKTIRRTAVICGAMPRIRAMGPGISAATA